MKSGVNGWQMIVINNVIPNINFICQSTPSINITYKIIGAKSETTMSVFADESEIPDWAKSAIVSLSELGILSRENGKINPNSPLTRAQTAQILMSLLEYRGKIAH